jgi:hypothetical protein
MHSGPPLDELAEAPLVLVAVVLAAELVEPLCELDVSAPPAPPKPPEVLLWALDADAPA